MAKKKQQMFNAEFLVLLDKIIRPTMLELLNEIAASGHNIEIINDTDFQQCYRINHKNGINYFQITFLGNDIEYHVLVSTEHNTKHEVDKDEKKYELPEITPELLKIIVAKGHITLLLL